MDQKKIATKVAIITMIGNLVLFIFKLIAGIIGKSSAMISDAVHSATDLFTTIIVLASINISNKRADEDHPYGHERVESIASLILAGTLAIIGIGIGISGIETIINHNQKGLESPTGIALFAAIISILIKEAMYWYTRKNAIRINSTALMADAWHHRTDSLSSVGSFIGIAGAMLGLPILDPLACIAICIFIVKAAYDLAKDATFKLIDKSCDLEVVEKMKKVITNQNGVQGVSDIKTRLFGYKVYVEVEIEVDGDKKLNELQETAQNVHNNIEKEFEEVKHCIVTLKPIKI